MLWYNPFRSIYKRGIMVISYQASWSVKFLCASVLIALISNQLYAQDGYYISKASNNPACVELIFCNPNVQCPELPSCSGARVGVNWQSCRREGCSAITSKDSDELFTTCDYRCTEKLLPLSYRFQEVAEPFVPGIVAFTCIGMGAIGALWQGKPVSVKRLCAYACVGGLWGLQCLLTYDKSSPENTLLALAGAASTIVVSECIRLKTQQ